MAGPPPYVPALGFRWLTPLYDALVGFTTRERAFKSALLDQAAIEPGWKVLDLACGTGTLAVAAQQRCPSARVTGIDGDPQMLASARRKTAEEGLEIELLEGLSHALPFADGAFDCVLSTLFFHHLEPSQKRTALREVRRVLKPGRRRQRAPA